MSTLRQAGPISSVALVGYGMLALGAVSTIVLPIWSLIYLTFVATSVSILTVRAGTDGHRPGTVLRVVVIPLLFCYLRTEFVARLAPWTEIALGTLPVLVLAGIAARRLWLQGGQEESRSRLLAVVIGLLSSATVLGSVFVHVQESLPGAQGGAWTELPEVILLAVSSYALLKSADRREVKLVSGFGVAPLIVGAVIGWWTLGSAYGHFRAAKALLVDGDVTAAKVRVKQLREAFGSLDFEPLAPRAWVRATADELQERGSARLWVELAEMAVAEMAWNEASLAYQKASSLAPNDGVLRIRIAQLLFEEGFRREAIAAFDRLTQYSEDVVPVHLSKAIALARMGELGRANEVIDEAIEAGWGILEDFRQATEPSSVRRTTVGELLSADVDLDDAGATLYDIVGLLQARGISVLHPDMLVGSTDIRTSQTLRMFIRPEGDPAREHIIVGSDIISTHKFGTSLIALHPENGALEARLLRSLSGPEIARFLQQIPRGHIVAGTIDDRQRPLTKEARRAFKGVGIGRFPNSSAAQAFVGVQGARSGTALHAVGVSGPVSLGVLAGTIDSGASAAEIEALVSAAARTAETGVALYVAGVERDSEVVLARAER